MATISFAITACFTASFEVNTSVRLNAISCRFKKLSIALRVADPGSRKINGISEGKS
jgi:hypothetical protein